MELIDRQAAVDAVNGLIDRFEQILRNIRKANGDDSACGMCEYDGAYIGQSGDWCNECPGFDKEDCFKLSDKCRKRWLKSVELPPVQPNNDLQNLAEEIATFKRSFKSVNSDYFTGYMSALSLVEGMIAEREVTE